LISLRVVSKPYNCGKRQSDGSCVLVTMSDGKNYSFQQLSDMTGGNLSVQALRSRFARYEHTDEKMFLPAANRGWSVSGEVNGKKRVRTNYDDDGDLVYLSDATRPYNLFKIKLGSWELSHLGNQL